MTLAIPDFQRLSKFSIDHAVDALLWLDADGRVLYGNASAARILGGAPDQLVAQSFFEIAPDLNPGLWRELWKEIRARGNFSFEFSLLGAENRPRQVELTVYRFEIAPQEFACVFFRDLEERQRLKLMEQEFVSTVSHELRTPLTVIREGVSQVADGLRGEINDKQARALSIALTGIDRLGRMIGDLLDLSKMESDKVTPRRERIDLSILAREVAVTFQTMATDRAIDLRITIPAGPVIVFADKDRLIQVLTNLLGNAFKFTERGRIVLSVWMDPGSVSCAVEDSGVGLSSDDLGKIFSKFEQLGRLSVTGERGTGLGLSICKAILDVHKGRIWGESAGPSKGSRFIFELPRQNARDVFLEQLSPVLQEVALRGGSLSTVTFDIFSAEGSTVPDAYIMTALEGLENLVRQHQGRKPAILIKDVNAVYLAMPSTVAKEADRMALQIQTAFQEALAREGLASRLETRYRIANFPDDTVEPNSFLKSVLPHVA